MVAGWVAWLGLRAVSSAVNGDDRRTVELVHGQQAAGCSCRSEGNRLLLSADGCLDVPLDQVVEATRASRPLPRTSSARRSRPARDKSPPAPPVPRPLGPQRPPDRAGRDAQR